MLFFPQDVPERRLVNFLRNLWTLIPVLGLGLAGCSEKSPLTYYDVTGEVLIEAVPVESGDIIFLPVDPELPPCGGSIIDGKYKLKAYPGEFRVKIAASRETGEMIPGPSGEDIPKREDYLPEKYNAKTELTADVAPINPNTIDFDLTE